MWQILRLKTGPERELQLSLERAVGESGNVPSHDSVHIRIRICQIDLVKEVVSIGPKLQGNTFRDGDILGERQITLEESRPAQRITSRIPDLTCPGALPWT